MEDGDIFKTLVKLPGTSAAPTTAPKPASDIRRDTPCLLRTSLRLCLVAVSCSTRHRWLALPRLRKGPHGATWPGRLKKAAWLRTRSIGHDTMPSLRPSLVSVTRIACLQAPRGHDADMSVSMSATCPLDHVQLEDATMRDTKRKYQRQSRNGATTATPPASRRGVTLYCRPGKQ